MVASKTIVKECIITKITEGENTHTYTTPTEKNTGQRKRQIT